MESDQPRFVVCGHDTLTYRLVEHLVERYNGDVTVILPPDALGQSKGIAALPGVRIVEAERPTAAALTEAGLAGADALALVEQNDGGNVDAALVARELNPSIRIVLRIFSRGLTEGVRRLLPGCAVLSSSALATPAFVAAALGETAPAYVRLPDRTLFEARREDVDEHDILCGLASNGREDPDLLPSDDAAADLVLAVNPPAAARIAAPRRPRRPLRALYRLVGRRLSIAFGVVTGLVVASAVALALIKDVSVAQAAYLTILNTVGGANADLGAPAAEKVVQTVLTLASIALLPLLTAIVVDSMAKARLAITTGVLTGPLADHVVVVGLGDVGARVIRALHSFDIDVVAIERSPDARGVSVARELRVPVIFGDGAHSETLRAAWVPQCRALIVLTTDDVANLETALVGQTMRDDLRVVVRLFDGDMADRVERTFPNTASRSVSHLAAPAFAAAMLGREVIGTIPVGRRLLLVAELSVGAGSRLEARPAGEVSTPGQARLLAVRTGRGTQTLWSPPYGRALARTDRLVVLATRTGLADLLARTEPSTDHHVPLLTHDAPLPRPRHRAE
ncbi:NAD-binding protein [Luedemannella flava]|uniref:NAD-binding protein n=1 Tax=Luedemannella flava TaxID=349316 RepID=UPI0031DC370D